MSARANSTMIVTQRQQGHMHVKINLSVAQNVAQYLRSLKAKKISII